MRVTVVAAMLIEKTLRLFSYDSLSFLEWVLGLFYPYKPHSSARVTTVNRVF